MDITEAFIKALHEELNEARRNPDINNKVAPRNDYGRKEYFKSMIKDKEIGKRDLVGNANQTSNNQPYGKNFDVIRYEKSPNEISNKYRAKINIKNGPYRQEYKDQAISEIETDINNYKQMHKQEARSHKEDNEKAAPRDEFTKVPRFIKNSPYNEIDVPKRAIIHKSKKPNEDGVVWGVVNKDEIDTYEQSTPDIERYKEYKADAERERDNAKYYNALAKQSDDRASDIVRDKKLARAKNTLQGKQVFKTENMSTDDYRDGAELRLEYWKTEMDRNNGSGTIVDYYPETEKSAVIQKAKDLMNNKHYAAIEVYNTRTGRPEYWTDGKVVKYFTNKIEESEDILKSYTITISDGENTRSFNYLSDNTDFDIVYDELYNYIMF